MNTKNKQFLSHVMTIIHSNIDNPEFSITELSKLTYLSRSQLHRKLKILTGMSAAHFIRSQRLRLAANLLQLRKHNITEVAHQTGFNNMSYFSKCFREKYGCSPSQFTKLD